MAAALTTAMCSAITVYAMRTKTDFTFLGPILFIVVFVFLTFGILGAILGFRMHYLWCALGVILFSFYLLIDIQMIMGGSNKSFAFDEDSYILAALCLYMDIIQIFLYILRLLGDR